MEKNFYILLKKSPLTGKAAFFFRLTAYTFVFFLLLAHRKNHQQHLLAIDYVTVLLFSLSALSMFLYYAYKKYNRRIALRQYLFDFINAGWLIAVMNFALIPAFVFVFLAVLNQIAAQGFSKLYRVFLLPLGFVIPVLIGMPFAPYDYTETVAILCYLYAAVHMIILSYISYTYARELKYKSRRVNEQHEKIKMQSEEVKALNEALIDLNHNLENTVEDRTKELKIKNKQLAEYAFINAHKLRAPISTLQGLLILMEKDEQNKELILKMIKESIETLVLIVTDIRIKLEREEGYIDPGYRID